MSCSRLDQGKKPPDQVLLRNVSLGYGSVMAVDGLDLRIEKGSFCTLLGPSGCGKTTLLRSIAGLVVPLSGDIWIKGVRINDIPIHRRNIGLVFQNYALFPHKNIFDNVAFGLKYRRVDRTAITRRVARALEIVRLPGVERRLPNELSGGQQQRVALARAIVIEPDVLLLDEPLSALDANLREEMRNELKTIQSDLGITTVFVTHDQEEALAVSDQVVVMNRGRIEQIGTPEEVYDHPQSRFVAEFLGRPNVLPAVALDVSDMALRIRSVGGAILKMPPTRAVTVGGNLDVLIRRDRIELAEVGGPKRENTLRGRIISGAYLGRTATYLIDVDGATIHALVSSGGQMFRQGTEVDLHIAMRDCIPFDSNGARMAFETTDGHLPDRSVALGS